MLKGLIFQLTVPCTNLYSVYLAVTSFVGPTLCHNRHHPVIWCCTASVTRITEVIYASGGITVPALRELDFCYQCTRTATRCIGEGLYPSCVNPAFPVNPTCLVGQHLGGIRECHHTGRCHTAPIVDVVKSRH